MTVSFSEDDFVLKMWLVPLLSLCHCVHKLVRSSQCAMSGLYLDQRDEGRPRSSTSIPCQPLLRLYFPFERSISPERC